MKNINTISHKNINKSNLYFTRKEFSKILSPMKNTLKNKEYLLIKMKGRDL